MRPSERRQCLLGLGGLVLWAWAAAPSAHAADALDWDSLKARIRSRYPEVPQLSVPTLQAWLRDAQRARPVLIDTRTPQEFADGHLEGAVNAESETAALRLLNPRAPGVAAVLYCSVGYRSSALARSLLARGTVMVYNLEGSIFEWANAGLPVVSSNGITGKVHPYSRRRGALLRHDLWSREP
jgi:rhodanese-related sulfurtransferase